MYSRVPPVPEIGTDDLSADDSSESSQSDPTSSSSQSPASGTKKRVVSDSILQRFEALKKRTDDVTRRSTEKRLKHLQKTVVDKVVEEFTHPDDIDELRKHDVKFGPPVKSGEKGGNSTVPNSAPDKETVDRRFVSGEEWDDVRRHLSVNDHLVTRAGPSHSKSGLEQEIDSAIRKGDISAAEQLSDSLAARDFGAKIAHAIDARDFLKRKREEENQAKMKKKKKLAWGFEHKQRWETKSNM